MNPLLSRIADLEARCRLPEDGQLRRALRLLDWSRVADQIASLCHNRRAAAAVRRRRPYAEEAAIGLWWELADELRPAGEAGRWPPLIEVGVAVGLLGRPAPLRLDGSELVHLAATAEGLAALRGHLLAAAAACPRWAEGAGDLPDPGPLAADLRRALDRDGRVLDAASPVLGRLRRAAVAQEARVRGAVERAMEAARRRGLLTGPAVTVRGDRYCLPVRSGSRRAVPGIVHDRSGSGGTLFIEPAAVVDVHNELAELRLEIAAEEQRILQELNRRVEAEVEPLREGCDLLLLVDQVRAGLLWSRQVRGRRPRLQRRGPLRIRQGRHPLLLRHGPRGGAAAGVSGTAPAGAGAEAGAEVVPLDLELPAGRRVLLISGPNAGGKSVALKTVGVFCLLAQCGWDVPAREDTGLPLIGRLLVDLGDEQSIEMSLSSFSAHLGNLVRFLEVADGDSLVLCDEIGSGTDPQEGTALAFSVLEELARRRCLVLASTHYGLLKAAVHEHPDMINAAMDFDEESLRPLYSVRMGVPGASHAFAIAARCRFPADLVARARRLVGEERFRIERLLGELSGRARALAEQEERARSEADLGERRARDLEARLADIEAERRRVLAEARQRGEDLLREGRRLVENTVRELRSAGGDDRTVRQAHRELGELARRLPPAPEPEAAPADLRPGQRVRLPHLGLTGQVVEVRGDRVLAEAEGLRLTVDRGEVEPLPADAAGGPAGSDRGPVTAGGGWRWVGPPPEASPELDLRGLRAEEAWDELDRLIDRAIPAGLRELTVIHGVGTGRLREALHERLAADARVASFREAPLQRGGHGVTLVRVAG